MANITEARPEDVLADKIPVDVTMSKNQVKEINMKMRASHILFLMPVRRTVRIAEVLCLQ